MAQWILKVLTFSLSALIFCGLACWPVPFFTQFSEAVNCMEGKDRATNTQNIEKVEVIKHLSQIVRDIKNLILNFSNCGFKGQKTMIQYKLCLPENILSPLKYMWIKIRLL